MLKTSNISDASSAYGLNNGWFTFEEPSEQSSSDSSQLSSTVVNSNINSPDSSYSSIASVSRAANMGVSTSTLTAANSVAAVTPVTPVMPDPQGYGSHQLSGQPYWLSNYKRPNSNNNYVQDSLVVTLPTHTSSSSENASSLSAISWTPAQPQWMDHHQIAPHQPMLRPQGTSPSMGVSTGQVNPGALTSSNQSTGSSSDDELIPTAIVIKNIPFAIKKEQLLDVMTSLGLPLPYAFNYHFDNGVFRGLAFANFTTADETGAVITNLNGREIGGRKLRVEYKKMLPLAERERIEREKRERRGQLEEQHRPKHNNHSQQNHPQNQQPQSQQNQSSNHHHAAHQHQHHQGSIQAPIQGPPPQPLPKVDLNDPETLEFYSQILLFRDDKNRSELVYPPTLSPSQRRVILVLCSQLGVVFSGQDKSAVVIRKQIPGSSTASSSPQSSSSIGFEGFYGSQQQPASTPSSSSSSSSHQQQQPPQLFQQFGGSLRGTKSFADIRTSSTNPYNSSTPGTPSGGSPFFPSQTPPPQPSASIAQAGPSSSSASSQPLAPLSLSLQQQRGYNYFTQQPTTSMYSSYGSSSAQQDYSSHPQQYSIGSLTDSFSSVMSLGGVPLSRVPSVGNMQAAAGSVGSSSPTASVSSIPTDNAGVIGSKLLGSNSNPIIFNGNDSNEATPP